MAVLRILTVCTGNTCRSPMAAALLGRHLDAVGLEARIRSAGTLGWGERPATTHAVTVMAERGLDIVDHRSRRLEPDDLAVDLVVAMTRDHAGAVVARDPALRSRVFLPAEFSRLGDGLAVTGPPAEHVRRVGDGRVGPVIGRPHEEIADPAGEPIEIYRATAERLDRALGDLARALVGER